MVDTMNFDITPDNDEEEFAVDFGEVQRVGGGGGTSDFNQLTNRPEYNGQKMTGDTNIPEVPAKTSDLTNDGADGTSTYVEANDLAKVAATGEYGDLSNTPTIPIVNDATLTITQNGTSKGTFTANDSDDTTIELSDTTYSDFTGTDGQTAGAAGLVPAPATTDAGKFLKADGTWDTAGGGGPTVVQTTGTSTTDVMSQNATTEMIYSPKQTSQYDNWGAVYIGNKDSNNNVHADPADSGTKTYFYGLPYQGSSTPVTPQNRCVCILGSSTGTEGVSIGMSSTTARGGVVIGSSAHGYSNFSVAIGHTAEVSGANYGVALGAYSKPTRSGEVNIGTGTNPYGYNSTAYRVIGGVHDGQLAQDAVTVNQINNLIDAINTATGLNISHIGA